MNGFAAALRARVRLTPDAAALVWQEREISFADLAGRADRAAGRLRELGVRPGDRVATLLPNGIAFVELLHGLVALGAVLLPVNTRLVAAEVRQLLCDAEPALLVHDADLAALAVAACAEVERSPVRIEVGDAFANPAGAEPEFDAMQRDDDPLVALLYTSGTTGLPKGVMLATSNLRASAVASQRHLGVRAGDRWLACLPLFHVGGLSLLLRSMIDGSCVVLHERFDARRVNAAIDSGEIAFVSLVPTMLDRLVRERGPAPPPRSLRAVLLGGAAASAELLELAEAWPIAPTYGLTEAASQVATRPPASPRSGLVPLPGTRIRVVQRDGAPCPPGGVGEILVAGPTLMRGYWQRPEATARALAGGWLHTGDLGALDAAGGLTVVARRADLIVSGGENVYPAEVEAVLSQHRAVREVAVVGIPDAEFGARPAAWLVAEQPLDPDALRAWCRERIAPFKVPVAFHFVAELPRNASGKLLRRCLGDVPALLP